MKGEPSATYQDSSFHGYWNPAGSWIHSENPADYWDAPSGSMTRGIRQLVWLRRNKPSYSPAMLAELIRVHQLASAFPNLEQWSGLDLPAEWSEARMSTSAEVAVHFAGYPPVDTDSGKSWQAAQTGNHRATYGDDGTPIATPEFKRRVIAEAQQRWPERGFENLLQLP